MSERILTALAVSLVLVAAAPSIQGQPRVWIADQGNNQAGAANPNNRILEIDPINHKIPPDAEGDIIILQTLPSPAGAFLDELAFDDQHRLWCVVKEDSDQDPDGAKLIDPDNNPATVLRAIAPTFPNELYGGFLEGLAWDGSGLWLTAVRQGLTGNMLTRVSPLTGAQIAPFDSGPLGAAGKVNIPGTVAQGLLYQPPAGAGYGFLWHSDVSARRIYKLDIGRLYDGDPGNDNNLSVAEFSVPFGPKGMDWMGDKIWVASPFDGIYQFDPATGASLKLFNAPQWNLDGVAILPPSGPRIVLSTPALSPSPWIGDNADDDTFTVANGGDDVLNYTITDSATPDDWLSVTPPSGSSAGSANAHTVSYAVSGKLAGTYSAAIIVTGNAWNSPRTISVTLTIRTVKPDLDRDGDVDQQDFGALQVCYTQGGSQPEGPCREADFNSDNLVNQADLTIFLDCLSGQGVLADRACHPSP